MDSGRPGGGYHVRLNTTSHAEPTDANDAIHRLENGDRLKTDEFLLRYESMRVLKQAELIEGVVYVYSLVRQQYHESRHIHLFTWLGYFEAATLDAKPVITAQYNSARQMCLNRMFF